MKIKPSLVLLLIAVLGLSNCLFEEVGDEPFFLYDQPIIHYSWGEAKIYFLNVNTTQQSPSKTNFGVGVKLELRTEYLKENCYFSVNKMRLSDSNKNFVREYDGRIKPPQKLNKATKFFSFIFYDDPVPDQNYFVEIDFLFSDKCDFEKKRYSEEKLIQVHRRNGVRRIELLMNQ